MQVAEPRYQQQTPIVDTRYTPSATLLSYVEGSVWATNYYSQVVGSDSELAPQQNEQAAAYQQYCLVEGMELMVSTPLQSVQDTVTNAITVTGAATTAPRFIPNKNDMFAADIGDGRMGLFTITLAEKRSYHKDALYHVEYTLVDYADSDAGRVRMGDLEEKTVKRGIFRKDFLHFGQNPVVLSQDFDYLIKFEDAYEMLLGHWIHDFFSREYQTLLIPDQPQAAYDPFLTRGILDWISTDDHPYVARIKMPRVRGDHAMVQTTVWDALAKMEKHLLPVAMYRAKLIDTVYFRNQPEVSGIFFTGIKYLMYPLDNRTDVDANPTDVPPSDMVGLTPGGLRYLDLQRLMENPLNGLSYTAVDQALPDIVPVTFDDYYVFSAAFYTPSMALKSNLEKIVRDAIHQKPIDKAVLLRLANAASSWGNLERFYYIPALLALLKVATRTN